MPDLIKLDGIEALNAPSQRQDLIRARLAIHASVPLQKLFELAESEQWHPDRLAYELEWELLGVGVDVSLEVCRFLADEFQARDKTTTLLVSAETGLAVAQVPEDAIYIPAPVAREGTDQLAVPLPRLKPDLEAAIIRYRNAVAEEPLVLAKLQGRARSTELQLSQGDARLQISTRTGRKMIGDRIRDELPKLLFDQGGSIGRLLQRCRINQRVPGRYATQVSLTLHGHASMLVADPMAMNFRHDAYSSARERIRSGWGRHLAQAVSGVAHTAARPQEVTTEVWAPLGLLIGPPDLAAMARHFNMLPVAGALATEVSGFLYLNIQDDSYEFASYEAAARWCVDASVRVDVHLDTRTLHPLLFTDLIESEIVAEVL